MAGHGLSWVAKKTAGSSPRIPGRNYDPNLLEDIVGSSKLKRRRCGGLCVRCYSLANGLPKSAEFQFLEWCIGSIYPKLSPAYRRGYTRAHRELRHAPPRWSTRLLACIGVGWGQPANKELFITNQKSVEAFYRLHLCKELSVTTGITYIRDPPLNLTEDEVAVFSIRGRFEM